MARTDDVGVLVALLAAFHVALGLFQLLAAGTFFEHVGNYGAENTHYVGDVGSFTLGYGIALAIAVRRTSWRVPVLWVGALWYLVHAVNHATDVVEAISTARGWLDTLLILIGAAALAYVAHVEVRRERDEARH
jgi:hypothetical protein